jgi:hypothetical protein
MTRRPSRPRAYAPDPAAPGRLCDHPGCPNQGEYRAPKSRTNLNEYHWFCLEHVRAYNAGWDFYKGMSPGEIERQVRLDTAWQRPTWPLGRLGHAQIEEEVLRRTPFGSTGGPRGPRRSEDDARAPADLREPLATFGLEWPTTLDVVKSRYKELAKRHHPDANGGDRGAEERLKVINLAYAALRSRLTAESRVATA